MLFYLKFLICLFNSFATFISESFLVTLSITFSSVSIGSNSSCKVSLTVFSSTFSCFSSSGSNSNCFFFLGFVFCFSFFNEENNSSKSAIFFSDLATFSFTCFFSLFIIAKKSANLSYNFFYFNNSFNIFFNFRI